MNTKVRRYALASMTTLFVYTIFYSLIFSISCIGLSFGLDFSFVFDCLSSSLLMPLVPFVLGPNPLCLFILHSGLCLLFFLLLILKRPVLRMVLQFVILLALFASGFSMYVTGFWSGVV